MVRVLVLALFFLAPAALAQSPEDIVRRFLLLAYDGRFAELPKSANAATRDFEQRVRQQLRVRCMTVEHAALTRGKDDAIDAAILLTKSDTASDWTSEEIARLRFVLVRDAGTWLVSEVVNTDAEFASRLLTASDDERAQLLATSADRISPELARAVYARGIALLNGGKFPDAARAFSLATRLAIDAGDRGGEALAHGAQQYTLNDPGAQLAVATRSLQIAEETSDPDVLARAWYDLGRAKSSAYWEARNPAIVTERMRCYRNALRYARRAEDAVMVVRTLYSMANIAANAQTDYLAARRYVDEAIRIAREVGDATGEMGSEIILATIYFQQSDLERGLFHHLRAVEIAERIGAFAYPSLLIRTGSVHVEMRELDKARAAFARILTREGNRVKTKFGRVADSTIGEGLRAMAIMEAETGDLGEAECLMREADAYFGGAGSGAGVALLSPFHRRRGDSAAALRVSLAALDNPALYPDQKMHALTDAASAYRDLGQSERSLASALEAIEIGEEIETRVAGDARQRALSSRHVLRAYEEAAQSALVQNDAAAALALLERARARVLSDIVEHGRPGAMREANAALDAEERRLEQEMGRLNLDLARAASRDAVEQKLRKARAAHASFVDGRHAREERTRSMRTRLDAAKLGEHLPRRTAAIAYLVAEERLHVFLVRAGQPVTHRAVTVKLEEVQRSVDDLAGMVARRDLRVAASSRRMYDVVIAPIESELRDVDNLLIVPDRMLWRVPFAALLDANGRFVAERFAIVHAPSISYFAAVSAPAPRSHVHPAGSSSLLAIGNPRRDSSDALPDAEREVDAIAALYNPALVLKASDATEARAKAAMRDARIIHFATHALLDDANPMYSRLALANGADDGDDGWLESWEVARLDLDADMVVLSACETARGRIGGGEGVAGMAWSFFLAGARSTVATQWKVASDTTSRLMIAFHRALRAPAGDGSFRKAAALRDAQLRFIRDDAVGHPFFWAGFVLLGDASTHGAR